MYVFGRNDDDLAELTFIQAEVLITTPFHPAYDQKLISGLCHADLDPLYSDI